MINILEERFFLYKNLGIINQDILKVDLKNKIKQEKEKNGFEKVKIVANLPYYITTPIIMKLLEEELDLESITVMIQKEVADRLTAIPGKKEYRSHNIYSILLYRLRRNIRSSKRFIYTRTRSNIRSNKIEYKKNTNCRT